MTQYYEILGLQPGASKEEIKAAYHRLCQECHPDKLPPDTPKKARQIVEEHFKQINEAYAYLMECSEEIDRFNSSKSYQEADSSPSIFDVQRMEAVRMQLILEREAIEEQYKQRLKKIEKQKQEKLSSNGLQEIDLERMDTSAKLESIIVFIFLGVLGLMFGMWTLSSGAFVLVMLAVFWVCACILRIIEILASRTVSSHKYKIICQIKKELAQAKTNALNEKERLLQEQSNYIRARVDYFKSLPLAVLSESFIEHLSDEDQFFLLMALKEREDAEKLTHKVRTGAQVAGAVGVVLLLSELFSHL